MNLNDLKISSRLGLGIATAAALLVAMIWVGVNNMQTIKMHLDESATDRLPKILAAMAIKDGLRERASVMRDAMLNQDVHGSQQADAHMTALRKQYANISGPLHTSVTSTEGTKLLVAMDSAVASLREPTDRILELASTGRTDEARAALTTALGPLQTEAIRAADAFAQRQVAYGEQAQQAAQDAYLNSIYELSGLGLAALLLLVIFGALLTRSITRPLRRAVEMARLVASGNLSHTIAAQGKNETAQLLAAMGDMQSSLSRVVQNVRQNAESVAVASEQISQGNTDLSARTESQAGALEETSASMEQLASTVSLNADSAMQADTLAQAASTIAVRGGEVVGRVVDTMQAINESSRQITEIISVIDNIAFQTNILALNAAVEAARAGDEGRGFAVVAAEVRRLAQRSAEAAKQINILILANVQRVDTGTHLVGEAGETMREVESAIQRVTQIMGEISSASAEQAAGVAQIGQAVLQMDQATQQNAALVEESASASESLREQSRQLIDAVAIFTLPRTFAIQTDSAVAPFVSGSHRYLRSTSLQT